MGNPAGGTQDKIAIMIARYALVLKPLYHHSWIFKRRKH